MDMPNEFKKLLEDAMTERRTDRERTSLYLSRSVKKDFRAACQGAGASRVIEKLMRLFVESKRGAA